MEGDRERDSLKLWDRARAKMREELRNRPGVDSDEVLDQLGRLDASQRKEADRLAREVVAASKGTVPFQLALSTAIKSLDRTEQRHEEETTTCTRRDEFCRDAWWHD